MKHASSLPQRALYASYIFLASVCLMAAGEVLSNCQALRPDYKPLTLGMMDKTYANPVTTLK